MTWMPWAMISRSNGSASSRRAPSPLMISKGLPVPRVEVRSRTPSTSKNRMTACPGGEAPGAGVPGAAVSADRTAADESGEGSDTGDVPSDDEGLDGFGALVGVQCLDVGHVPDDVVVQQNPVAAHQVPALGEDLAGPAGVVHLGQRGDGVGGCSLFLPSGQLPA